MVVNIRNAKNKISLFTFLLISVIFVLAKINQINTTENYLNKSTVIAFDVYGYYLHLPATIIHHDPGIEDKSWFDTLNTKYQKGIPLYQVAPGQNGRLVNVYPVGIAFIWSPFFFAGHLIAGLTDYQQDGLSKPYQLMIVIAGLFYAILGIFLLRKLLLKFVSDQITALTLFFIAIGTNLFYYATYDNAMPHIFLFPFDILIILLTISWHENPKRKTAFFLGIILALVTISRPSEIVWVLIPILWNVQSPKSFLLKFQFFRTHLTHILCLCAGLILLGSVQLIYWKYTSGNWVSNNHYEGFDFFRPFTLKVLFSYKKGWLLYTPMMLLSIIGLVLLFRWNRKLFTPLFLFFIANLWFISSWECWWYAASFGQRPFIQSYGMMAIPLAFLLDRARLNQIFKWSIILLAMLFTTLNQFQTWQMMHGVIHPLLMTKTFYWQTFGKTVCKSDGWKSLEIDRGNLPPIEFSEYTQHKVLFVDYESQKNLLRDDQVISDTFGYNSMHCEMFDQEHVYGIGYKARFDSICSKDHLRIKMECDVFISSNDFEKEMSLACNFYGNRKQTYGYNAIPVQRLGAQPGQWSHVEAWFVTAEVLHSDDILCLQIWNNGGGKVWMDNIRYTLYEPKEK